MILGPGKIVASVLAAAYAMGIETVGGNRSPIIGVPFKKNTTLETETKMALARAADEQQRIEKARKRKLKRQRDRGIF